MVQLGQPAHGNAAARQSDPYKMDDLIADAQRTWGGLVANEYPILSVTVSETRIYVDGEEYADLHTWATPGASRLHVIGLLERALELARAGLRPI